MADQSTTISNPIKIRQDSEAWVAFELAQQIAIHEDYKKDNQSPREYWLTLYHQCRLAASSNKGGYSLNEVLSRS